MKKIFDRLAGYSVKQALNALRDGDFLKSIGASEDEAEDLYDALALYKTKQMDDLFIFKNKLYCIDFLASFFNDELREFFHSKLAPCTAQEFIDEYISLDPEFASLI